MLALRKKLLNSIVSSSFIYKHIYLVIVTFLAILAINIILHIIDERAEEKIVHTIMRNYLENIQQLIVKDLTNISSSKDIEDLLIIKNYKILAQHTVSVNGVVAELPTVYGSKAIIDFSNVVELLEDIAKDNFYYAIELNNNLLCGVKLEEGYDIVQDIDINNSILSIKLKLNKKSLVARESKERIVEKKLNRALISISLFIFICFGIFQFMKIKLKIQRYKTKIQNIQNFYRHEKSYILNCYQHSQNDKKFIDRLEKAGLLEDSESNDYFPIFLAPMFESNPIYNVDPKEFRLESMVEGYNIIHNCNINLILKNQASDGIVNSLFEPNMLHQIIFSILRNFMHFRNSSDKQETIEINFGDYYIDFSCTGIRLQKEHLIKYSKNIFGTTGNVFILNFQQIFRILEIFNYSNDIQYLNNKITLKISFEYVSNEKYEGNILPFSHQLRNK